MLWSTKRACKYLDVSRSTLHRLRKASPDELGAVKLGSRWRFPVHRIKNMGERPRSPVEIKRDEIMLRYGL